MMGTLTDLVSERNIRVAETIFAAAEVAATSPQPKTSLLAEIAERLEPGVFSFSFLSGFAFFGYRSEARDLLLTVLERSMAIERGRGIARFEVEGHEGVLIFDYRIQKIEITLDGHAESWRRRTLPKRIEAALAGKVEAERPATPLTSPRLRKGASYEFLKGKESVVISYCGKSVRRLRRQPRQRQYRQFTEALIGLSPKTRMKARVASLLKQGFRYAGERRIQEREIAPMRITRTLRAS